MGCAASVRSDLSEFDEITIVELDPQASTGKFQLKKGFDFETVLADLSKTNSHIEGWSRR
jgi:hypothetical protein